MDLRGCRQLQGYAITLIELGTLHSMLSKIVIQSQLVSLGKKLSSSASTTWQCMSWRVSRDAVVLSTRTARYVEALGPLWLLMLPEHEFTDGSHPESFTALFLLDRLLVPSAIYGTARQTVSPRYKNSYLVPFHSMPSEGAQT